MSNENKIILLKARASVLEEKGSYNLPIVKHLRRRIAKLEKAITE